MNEIAIRLRAFWISKLGADFLDKLQGGSTGNSVLEKAVNVIRQQKSDPNKYKELIWNGFDGYFHQSVFSRILRKNSLVNQLAKLPIGEAQNRVEWWAKETLTTERLRVLGAVQKKMEFLSETGDLKTQLVSVPFLIEAQALLFRIRVLTVQSTISAWNEIMGFPISRILTHITANELADVVCNVLEQSASELGEMDDLSSQVKNLLKNTNKVHVYSGAFMVGNVGRTRHTAERGLLGRHRRPLHVVMQDEYKELISADHIRYCEIEFQEAWKGLPAGTYVILFPIEGKIVFRRMLGRGVIDDFLAYLAH